MPEKSVNKNMSEDKKSLQIELLQLDISKFTAPRESRHVATVDLIWPRVLVASRTAVKTLILSKGKVDLRNVGWLQRILFKETVEYDFGILFKVSQSMTSAAFDEFMRYVGGTTLGSVATIVDKGVGGGIVGDVAASPFAFLKKKAQASSAAETILEGGISLKTSELKDGQEIEIPLVSLSNRYEQDITALRHRQRKLTLKAGTRCGTAVLKLSRIGKKNDE